MLDDDRKHGMFSKRINDDCKVHEDRNILGTHLDHRSLQIITYFESLHRLYYLEYQTLVCYKNVEFRTLVCNKITLGYFISYIRRRWALSLAQH